MNNESFDFRFRRFHPVSNGRAFAVEENRPKKVSSPLLQHKQKTSNK